jgi:GAF domain-containing protein
VARVSLEGDDAAVFADLAMRLHEEPTMQQTLDRVVEFALSAVGCRYAGVMLLHGRQRVESAAVTDPVAAKADQLQLAAGEGPCLAAITDERTYRVDDASTDQRWPRWCPLVAELGLRSVLSVRLFTSDTTVGALNLFDPEPLRFDADDVAVAHVLARHAAIALASSREVENLELAVDARSLVGQAQGILMERFDLDADRAFAVLRRYSQDHNIKLRAVAQRLVDTRKLPATAQDLDQDTTPPGNE